MDSEGAVSDLLKHGLCIEDVSDLRGAAILEAPCSIERQALLGEISLGAFSFLGAGGEFHRVRMGRFCSVARRVVVGPGEHPTDWTSTHPMFYGDGVPGIDRLPVYKEWWPGIGRPGGHIAAIIGNDVWIGDGAYVASGVIVGDGAIIGARAVVTRDVEPYAIVVGSPAKVVRHRFDQTLVERFLRTQWWNYDLRAIKDRLDFSQPGAALSVIEEAAAAGTLARFTPQKWRVDRSESGAVRVARSN
ncbi:MAG: CatB-related O-acetyltransferase [Proteobacteria bacterium]|nr:CatB-related O-acetyltransferase [Pseudomonadota bacterium]